MNTRILLVLSTSLALTAAAGAQQAVAQAARLVAVSPKGSVSPVSNGASPWSGVIRQASQLPHAEAAPVPSLWVAAGGGTRRYPDLVLADARNAVRSDVSRTLSSSQVGRLADGPITLSRAALLSLSNAGPEDLDSEAAREWLRGPGADRAELLEGLGASAAEPH